MVTDVLLILYKRNSEVRLLTFVNCIPLDAYTLDGNWYVTSFIQKEFRGKYIDVCELHPSRCIYPKW